MEGITTQNRFESENNADRIFVSVVQSCIAARRDADGSRVHIIGAYQADSECLRSGVNYLIQLLVIQDRQGRPAKSSSQQDRRCHTRAHASAVAVRRPPSVLMRRYAHAAAGTRMTEFVISERSELLATVKPRGSGNCASRPRPPVMPALTSARRRRCRPLNGVLIPSRASRLNAYGDFILPVASPRAQPTPHESDHVTASAGTDLLIEDRVRGISPTVPGPWQRGTQSRAHDNVWGADENKRFSTSTVEPKSYVAARTDWMTFATLCRVFVGDSASPSWQGLSGEEGQYG
ncbi:hypothetical protein GGX14DRAFT_409001 [Mycena pura]|uniref:Uncharacterized protein n=1 Tax=Mycena pura TaxID=153505 RepID=A0AAD6UJZ9_9AGAR|nr:hypothetical protein GGX14DRAFT_409001 [Mycena pura]